MAAFILEPNSWAMIDFHAKVTDCNKNSQKEQKQTEITHKKMQFEF